MLTQSQMNAYRKLRADGASAKDSLAYAYSRDRLAACEWAGLSYDDSVKFEREGFTIRIVAKPDEYPDTSWLGEFSNHRDLGAVRHASASRDCYEWFNPERMEAQHYEELRQLKVGKARARELAHKYVRQDYETACDEVWCFIRVTASRDGVVLGEDTLGGVDSGYVAEAVLDHDMVDNAIEAAREKLAALCECAS